MIRTEILTRKQAKARGLTRFFNGVKCKHGHISDRQTNKGECIECKRVWSKNNRHVIRAWVERVGRERARLKRAANRDEVNRKKREEYHAKGYIRAKEWRAENREIIREKYKEYAERNGRKSALMFAQGKRTTTNAVVSVRHASRMQPARHP